MTSKNRKGPRVIKVGDTVFFTAFTKNNRDILYACEGEITKCPDQDKGKMYRVLIKAVGQEGIGKKSDGSQLSLVGRAISKHRKELIFRLGPIFTPKEWFK